MKTKIRNVAVLDMTDATPESVSQIESIRNAAIVLVTPKTRHLVGQIDIRDLGNVIESKDSALADTPVQLHNGNTVMGAHMFESPGVIMVNGNIIVPSDIHVTDGKATLLINGNLYVPQNLQAELMGQIKHNGNLIAYPPGYELILGDMDLDVDAVPLGAKFFVTGKLTAVDIGAQKLREKDIRVHCGDAYVSQGLETAFAELNAKRIIPVPEGYAFIKGDIVLDDMTSALYGERLFIRGTADVRGLAGIESLRVTGRAYVPAKLARDFMRACPGFDPARLVVYGERMVRLSDCMLEPEMLLDGRKTCVIDDVEIDGAVTPQMLREGVEAFYLFGDIACKSALIPAVQELCKLQNGEILDVNAPAWRMMQEARSMGQGNSEDAEIVDDLRVIRNAVSYKL